MYVALSFDGKPSPDNPRTPTFSASLTPHFGVLAITFEDKSSLVIPRTPFAKLKVVPPCSGVLTNSPTLPLAHVVPPRSGNSTNLISVAFYV